MSCRGWQQLTSTCSNPQTGHTHAELGVWRGLGCAESGLGGAAHTEYVSCCLCLLYVLQCKFPKDFFHPVSVLLPVLVSKCLW